MAMPHDAACERDLVNRCLSGAPDAWQWLFRRYERALWGHLLRAGGHTIGDVNELEDIFQEVCVLLLTDGGRRLQQFDENRGSLAYFLQMQVQQVLHGWLRARSRSALRYASQPPEQLCDPTEVSPEFFAQELAQSLPVPQQQTLEAQLSAAVFPVDAESSSAAHRMLMRRVLRKARRHLGLE